MELLVTYDVSTVSFAGELRLRRVAKICEAYGQRVQKSVFECLVNDVQFEKLKLNLGDAIDPKVDSVRIYRLRERRREYLRAIGKRMRYDIHDPLIVRDSADPE